MKYCLNSSSYLITFKTGKSAQLKNMSYLACQIFQQPFDKFLHEKILGKRQVITENAPPNFWNTDFSAFIEDTFQVESAQIKKRIFDILLSNVLQEASFLMMCKIDLSWLTDIKKLKKYTHQEVINNQSNTKL